MIRLISQQTAPSARAGPGEADRRPWRPDWAGPPRPLPLRLPQGPGDKSHSQEAVVADGRRGAADVAGARAAEEVQRHETRARPAAAAALLISDLSVVYNDVTPESQITRVIV